MNPCLCKNNEFIKSRAAAITDNVYPYFYGIIKNF